MSDPDCVKREFTQKHINNIENLIEGLNNNSITYKTVSVICMYNLKLVLFHLRSTQYCSQHQQNISVGNCCHHMEKHGIYHPQ